MIIYFVIFPKFHESKSKDIIIKNLLSKTSPSTYREQKRFGKYAKIINLSVEVRSKEN